MSAIAEYLEAHVSGPQPHLYPITVTAYHRMGETGILDASERTELIDARIITMAPIGSEHADWIDRLTRLLITTVPENITVRPQNPVCLDERNEPQPDVALLASRQKPYREAHPRPQDVLLIIEVSDTTLSYDRDVKVPLYAQHGIPEVWVVDVAANRLEIYREPVDGGYRMRLKPRTDEEIALLALPEVRVDLGALF